MKNFKFVLSKRLQEKLKLINHAISDDLLNAHQNLEFFSKQSFIDISDSSDDMFSFIQTNKIIDIIGEAIEKECENEEIIKTFRDNIHDGHSVYIKNRSTMKIGRLINTIFPEKYKISEKNTGQVKPSDIESFVRLYVSNYDQDKKFNLLSILRGDDIATFYHSSKYATQNGSLGGSCMKNRQPDTFDIYSKNPEKVGLLVLFENNSKEKITARALVWTLSLPENRTYMERVYTNNSRDEQLFIDYAKSKGWFYKSSQSMGYDCPIVDSVSNINKRIRMIVDISNRRYHCYPYMDTLSFFNNKTFKLSNDCLDMTHTMYSTGGDISQMHPSQYRSHLPVLVHSNYHNSEIEQEEAHWCDIGQDWVMRNQAIRIYNDGNGTRTEHKFAVPNHPDICESYIPGIDYHRHFKKDRCVYSAYLNTWIFKSSKRKVIVNLKTNEKVIDHKRRENKSFVKVDDNYYSMNLVTKKKDSYILKNK